MSHLIRTSNIDSLTNFQKNAKEAVLRLEETQEPMILTVNGKARVVVQDAEAYQKLIDEVENNRFLEAVRQGLKESDEGLGRPAREVFEEMKARYGF